VKVAETFPGGISTRHWLAEAVRQYQLAADVRPANSSELFDVLADLAERTPAPRTELDEICGRHLLQQACLRIATSVMGDYFSRIDALLGWGAIWAALNLIGTTPWSNVAAELRALARQNRRAAILPKRVELHLRAHFAEVCRLIDVAHDSGASPRVLTKTFRQQYHCTVHQFLSLLRLRAAVRLLSESDLKVSAICASVGYGSQVDLYRQLRRFTRLTPAAIRTNPVGARTVLRTLDQWLSSHGLAA
jgi:AraC-like DNA-binding protein